MDTTFTLAQFNRLPNPEKYGLLEDHGTYLEVCRVEGPYKIALFSLASLYVEVWLHVKSDQIKKASAFNCYQKLDAYISQIDISFITQTCL